MTRQTTTDFAPMRPIGTIRPYGRNPRKNDGKPVDAVAESIRQFGFRQPIVVDADGVIIVGHTRYKAALKLGMAEVPVHVAEMTAAQAKAYRIADNKTGEAAEWDDGLLADELRGLDDFDITGLGFDDDELQRLLHPDGIPGLTDPDAIPENVPQVTQSGDLWILGNHRLLCGDSTKAEDVARVMGGVRADMMFADPPYGVDYDGGHFHSGDVNIKRKREKLASDDSTGIYAAFLPLAMNAVDGPCYVWFAGSLGRDVYAAIEDAGGVVSTLLIWHKTNATYAAMNAQYKLRHEPFLYFKPKGSTLRWVGPANACSLWEFDKEGINKLHPTQKPAALVANAIKNHSVATVFDPFSGSGTTIIAAEQLNRRCFAIEIEPKYVDVAVKRWEQFTGKTAERVPR